MSKLSNTGIFLWRRFNIQIPRKIDIIFLDIQMKDINGIEVAKKIRKFDEKVEIIFTTAFSEYAPKAMRFVLIDT